MKKHLRTGIIASVLMCGAFSASVHAFAIPQSNEAIAATKLAQIELNASHGDADAQFLLGLMHLAGRYVPQDVTLGFDWIERAALQQHSKAQQALADLAYEGKLIPRDLAKAEKWYKTMSEQGDKWAHFRLGFIYSAGGNGVVRNCGKAIEQFNAAGNPVALGNVAWILATCPEAEYRDGKRAVTLSLKLLETNQQDPTVLDNLAAAYAESGDFSSAINTQEKAIDALKNQPEVATVEEFIKRLDQYKDNKAYREIIPILD